MLIHHSLVFVLRRFVFGGGGGGLLIFFKKGRFVCVEGRDWIGFGGRAAGIDG